MISNCRDLAKRNWPHALIVGDGEWAVLSYCQMHDQSANDLAQEDSIEEDEAADREVPIITLYGTYKQAVKARDNYCGAARCAWDHHICELRESEGGTLKNVSEILRTSPK